MALSCSKIDKYEYLTGEEILPPGQRRMIEQANFTFSPFEKRLRNKLKQLKIKVKNKQNRLKNMEYNLAESNALIKKYDYNTEKDKQFFKHKKIYLINLLIKTVTKY